MTLYFIADESTGEMVDDTDYFRSEDEVNEEIIKKHFIQTIIPFIELSA